MSAVCLIKILDRLSISDKESLDQLSHKSTLSNAVSLDWTRVSQEKLPLRQIRRRDEP